VGLRRGNRYAVSSIEDVAIFIQPDFQLSLQYDSALEANVGMHDLGTRPFFVFRIQHLDLAFFDVLSEQKVGYATFGVYDGPLAGAKNRRSGLVVILIEEIGYRCIQRFGDRHQGGYGWSGFIVLDLRKQTLRKTRHMGYIFESQQLFLAKPANCATQLHSYHS
jgi:hypothetical protein